LTHIPPPRQLRRQTPRRKSRHRAAPIRKPNWLKRGTLASAGLIVLLFAWAAIERQIAPVSNTAQTRFDAIVVLGTPADADGNPTPSQLARVTEAVHEYERGVAPRLILTGGAAHNRFVEARVMAQAAHAQGIPEAALFVEPEAEDTIQNACYSARIMKAHGWTSAEVVSAASHLPRAGLIFSRLPIQWRTHAAPPLTPQPASPILTAVETFKTARYLVWADWAERCDP
jgi:uncharacterized SAM-binding protein YcdF (DUF218 family)